MVTVSQGEAVMLRQAFLAGTAGGLMVYASAVFAHARLQGTSPAADERLGVAPKSLTLRFNENVRLAVLKLSTAGSDVPIAFDRGAAAAAEVRVNLPSLAPGIYRVQWSALSTGDGHVVKGTFSFVIMAR
jgi:methionine-rich copper-binding protein CopC